MEGLGTWIWSGAISLRMERASCGVETSINLVLNQKLRNHDPKPPNTLFMNLKERPWYLPSLHRGA